MQPIPTPQQPQVVQPQPVPETWTSDLLPDGKTAIIQIHHLGGLHVSFMTAEQAIQIGEQLVATGRRGKSGLIVPPPGFNVPSPNGNGAGPGHGG